MAKLHLAQEILNIIYPVGSIYLSWNDTNPSTLFGGTWVKLKGGFVYGCQDQDTPGTGNGSGTDTGNTTLSINQMPSHTHTQKAHEHTVGSKRGKNDIPEMIGWYGGTGGDQLPYWQPGGASNNSVSSKGVYAKSTTAINNNTGGGQGHNHKIPYVAVFLWRRTA